MNSVELKFQGLERPCEVFSFSYYWICNNPHTRNIWDNTNNGVWQNYHEIVTLVELQAESFKTKVIYFQYLLPGSATYFGLGVVVSKLFYFSNFLKIIQKCLQLLKLVQTCLNWSKVVQIGQWLSKVVQIWSKLVITYPNMAKFSHAACIGLKVFWDLYLACNSTIVATLRCHYLIDNDNQLIFW